MFVLGAIFAALWAVAIWLGLRYREAPRHLACQHASPAVGGVAASLRRPAAPVGLRTHESLLITPATASGGWPRGEFT